MSDSLDALIAEAEIKAEVKRRPGTFDSESARVAASKSAAARRPIDKDKDGRKAYSYICQMADLIAARLLTAYEPCPHCKRGGPPDIRLLESLSKTLTSLSEIIIQYAWGRPAQESKSNRDSSVEDYKQALRQVNAEENKKYIPEDLPQDEEQVTP